MHGVSIDPLIRLSTSQRVTDQHVDGAAHAVLLVLVVHDGAVVQQTLQQAHHQGDKVLAAFGQVLVLPAVLQQTGDGRAPKSVSLSAPSIDANAGTRTHIFWKRTLYCSSPRPPSTS